MKRSLALLMLLSLACQKEAVLPSEAEESPAAAQPSTASRADFTEADLDAYTRGIDQEVELVKAARDRGAKASTPAERSMASRAEWEDATIPAAAQAAGIDEARYRNTRTAVHKVLETLDFQGKIDGPLSIDLTRADEATKARLAKDAFDSLTPAAAAALRARMQQVLPHWVEYMSLTALND